MDFFPGSVIPDGHRGMEDETRLIRRRAVIDDMAAQDNGIGDGNVLIFNGPDPRDQERFFYYIPRCIGNLDPISNVKRSRGGETRAGDRVGHNAG